MNDIIEDLFKIYISCTDSYNSKIHQTINDKYTIIDKSMLAIYLYIKILEDKDEKNEEAIDVLKNYILRQVIYSETGNIVLEITDESKIALYNEILDKLVLEKFEYKNRIMKKLKYNYTEIMPNKYSNLLTFLEDIAEFSIFQKLVLRGNQEAVELLSKIKNKISIQSSILTTNDYFYKEKKEIISLIENNQFYKSQYGKLTLVVLNLKDVYRYSNLPSQLPENVLLHQYTLTVISIMMAEYCNKNLNDNFDLYAIIVKSLFHDFGEYKGTEIITHFKNYNELSKRMFEEIEENDQKDLENQIGNNLYLIISNYKNGIEGYLSELIDKMLGIMKLWVEVGYLNNNTYIKSINSIYQDRFKRFLRINEMENVHNKEFYLELLREYYIYIKEHLIEKDLTYFLKYFTEEELKQFRSEINLLKNNPKEFLK
ncbi:MAG: HD domain-containing protein [Clostridia bacterium]|nr:HD domain-containing protein [Clostridia bacterium]